MKKIISSFLLLSSSFINATPSSNLAWIAAVTQGHMSFQTGAYWSNQGKQQHINIQELIGDEFTVTQTNDANALVGVGYFLDGQNFGSVQWRYGLNFFFLPKTAVSGQVIQENLFTNLSYSYHLTHYPLYAAIQAKKDLAYPPFSLIVDAGIGPNFMRASNFMEYSLDGMTLPDNIFGAHTTTTFSATAGVGLQMANVFGSVPLACGYRYFYLGEGHLRSTNSQALNTLNTGSAYANALVCSLSF